MAAVAPCAALTIAAWLVGGPEDPPLGESPSAGWRMFGRQGETTLAPWSMMCVVGWVGRCSWRPG